MATAGQTDPRTELFEQLAASVNLDAQAKAFLREQLDKVDPGQLGPPDAMARARQSMVMLAGQLSAGPARGATVTEAEVRLALRRLCPLFPIC